MFIRETRYISAKGKNKIKWGDGLKMGRLGGRRGVCFENECWRKFLLHVMS